MAHDGVRRGMAGSLGNIVRAAVRVWAGLHTSRALDCGGRGAPWGHTGGTGGGRREKGLGHGRGKGRREWREEGREGRRGQGRGRALGF